MENYILIRWLHVLLFGPLFIYVSLYRNKLIPIIYPILLGLGIMVLLYHLYKISTNPRWAHIYLIHIFLIAPCLIAVGYKKQKTSYIIYDYLMLLGFAAIGYNLLKLFPKNK